jgi:hypothetical protein
VTTPDNEWQRIWFATRQQPWTSLTLLPVGAGIDVTRAAEMLAATGCLHGERQVGVVNATGAQLEDVQQTIDSIKARNGRGEWTIVPVDPIEHNPATIAILRATSAALVLVRLGESRLAPAQKIIEMIGRDRTIGSVVLKRRRDR